jgi:glycerophosphoryl diester phosphodiesterase
MEAQLIDEALVSDLHTDGIRIIAWTANEEREIRRLIGLGVDGICGNYPDRIRAALG